MLWQFAQEAVKTTPSDPIGWVLQGGALGILAVLAWWVMFKGLPALQEDRRELVKAFKGEMEAERAGHRQEVEIVRQRCDTQAAEDRKLAAEQMEAERNRADSRSSEVAKSVTAAVKGLQDDIKENTSVTRDLVLELRDNTGQMRKNGGTHHD